MSDFEKYFKSMKEAFDKLPSERTPDCPTEEELFLLCFERDDGLLRQKYMTHILLCKYCGKFIREVLRAAVEGPDTSKIRSRIFPLPEEVDFENIKTLSLFKDKLIVSKVSISEGVGEAEFDIDSAGYYHLEIDTGQVIWMREIVEEDIFLTEKEQEEVLKYGVAASTNGTVRGITSIKESRWDDRLDIMLIKRLSKGRLSFRIKSPRKETGE
jgi:hypothetical protein